MAKKDNLSCSYISVGRVAQNRRARFDYELLETYEGGLVLWGSEVKSLRLGRANIGESYIGFHDKALMLMNGSIAPYFHANNFSHEERRMRSLLMKKKQILHLSSKVEKAGLSLIPLELYFNDRGIAKLKFALGKGKRKVDKRYDIKMREWNIEKSRILKNHSS